MRIVYVGCRTTRERNGHGKGISVYRVAEEGTWELIQLCEQINPSFLCLDQNGVNLYAVHGDSSSISSYTVLEDGKLQYETTCGTGGTNPVHLSVNRTNRWVFVANLQTGSVAVLKRQERGLLKGLHNLYFIKGNGGPGYISHPHQVQQSPDGERLIVSAQGRLQGVPQVVCFRIDHESGELIEEQSVRARNGSEPRHCVFSPDGDYCYGVNEKSFTVTQYSFHERRLVPLRIVQTLPDEQVEEGWASGIAVTPSGNALYTSDRKQNIVSCFHIKEGGKPCLFDTVSTMGQQPRFIGVSPEGTGLIAANELSDSIYEFPIDGTTGKLGEGILRAETGSPVCVVWGKTIN